MSNAYRLENQQTHAKLNETVIRRFSRRFFNFYPPIAVETIVSHGNSPRTAAVFHGRRSYVEKGKTGFFFRKRSRIAFFRFPLCFRGRRVVRLVICISLRRRRCRRTENRSYLHNGSYVFTTARDVSFESDFRYYTRTKNDCPHTFRYVFLVALCDKHAKSAEKRFLNVGETANGKHGTSSSASPPHLYKRLPIVTKSIVSCFVGNHSKTPG